MNVQTQTQIQTVASRHELSTARHHMALGPTGTPVRRELRVRDFGIGYGNSSGYASGRRYAGNTGAARFRFA